MLNGHQCTFTLDTGATQSIISNTFANRMNIEYENSGLTISVADVNNRPRQAGITPKCKVEIHGSNAYMQFLVYPLPDNLQCLLGLDWFRMTRAVVDTVERVLFFKQREINLVKGQALEGPTEQECYVADVDQPTEEDAINEDQTWDDQIPLEDVDLTDLYAHSPTMAEDLRHYLSAKRHMFAYSYGDLGCLKGHEHVISPNCEKPIYQHPYRKSIKERDEMKKEVGKM